jgi:hypothetical protein
MRTNRERVLSFCVSRRTETNFSIFCIIQLPPRPLPKAPRAQVQKSKRVHSDTGHSSTCDEVEKAWSYTATSPYALMVQNQVNKIFQFYFTFI